MPHTFRFTWDMAEQVRAARAVDKHMAKRGTQWLKALLPAFVIIVGATVLLGPAEGRLERLVAVLPWMIALLLWMVFMTWGFPYIAAWQFKRKDPSSRAEMFRTIAPEGLQAGTAQSHVTVAWDGILRAVETPEFILFYYNQRCAYYLPKRAIPDHHELQEVRALIASSLSTRALLSM